MHIKRIVNALNLGSTQHALTKISALNLGPPDACRFFFQSAFRVHINITYDVKVKRTLKHTLNKTSCVIF